jgi:hypothetical protein
MAAYHNDMQHQVRLLAVKVTFCLKWPFFKSLV